MFHVTILCDKSSLLEVNGYEAWQNSLFHDFVRFFAQKTQEVMISTRGTSQQTRDGFGNSAKVCEHKIKDCAGSWTFQHKSCDLCQVSKPVPYYNYEQIKDMTKVIPMK